MAGKAQSVFFSQISCSDGRSHHSGCLLLEIKGHSHRAGIQLVEIRVMLSLRSGVRAQTYDGASFLSFDISANQLAP